jgi:hypothetical protein
VAAVLATGGMAVQWLLLVVGLVICGGMIVVYFTLRRLMDGYDQHDARLDQHDARLDKIDVVKDVMDSDRSRRRRGRFMRGGAMVAPIVGLVAISVAAVALLLEPERNAERALRQPDPPRTEPQPAPAVIPPPPVQVEAEAAPVVLPVDTPESTAVPREPTGGSSPSALAHPPSDDGGLLPPTPPPTPAPPPVTTPTLPPVPPLPPVVVTDDPLVDLSLLDVIELELG